MRNLFYEIILYIDIIALLGLNKVTPVMSNRASCT